MENKKNIVFAGDSFTWGEGLELYIDNEFWNSQKQQKSEWEDLIWLQDDKTKSFREKYRFATAVANHFNCSPRVINENGGNYHRALSFMERSIDSDTVAVVFNHTNIMRMHLHLRPDICRCNYCSWARKNSFVCSLLDSYYQIVNCIVNEEKEPTSIQWKNIEFLKMVQTNPFELLTFKDWKKLNAYEKENWVTYFAQHIPTTIDKEIRQQFAELTNIFKGIEKKGIPVFCIDSWDDFWTRRMILENSDLLKFNIPLIGHDNKEYDNWKSWSSTYKNNKIVDEFPKTDNHHPSMYTNSLLYKSIVKAMNKRGITPKKRNLNYYDNILLELSNKKYEVTSTEEPKQKIKVSKLEIKKETKRLI